MAKGKYEKWLTEEGLIRVRGWAMDGLTDEQIAHNMGITVRTLYLWKEKHIQIFHALKNGKEVVDREVENALLKRAKGYRYIERVTETRYDLNGNPYEYTRVAEKEMPPDPTSLIFWLKNRKPKDWRDKPPEDADDRTITVKIQAGDYGD